MPSHQSIPIKRTFSDLPFALENYIKEKHDICESYLRSSNDTMKDIQRTEHRKCSNEFRTNSK